MSAETAKEIKTQAQIRCSGRWMHPETAPMDPDNMWSTTLAQEAEQHLMLPGVQMARDEILRQGAATAKEIAALRA
eukprot:1106465-Rhodomonas_salina.1